MRPPTISGRRLPDGTKQQIDPQAGQAEEEMLSIGPGAGYYEKDTELDLARVGDAPITEEQPW